MIELREEANQMEDLTFKQRDKHSVELKLRYLLERQDDKKRRKEGYRLGLYLFLPHSFHINPDTYARETFYEDTKLYIRFNTPFFKTSDLLDPESSESPLSRAECMIRGASEESPVSEERFIYETKILGAVYKSLLRESVRRLRRNMPEEDIETYVRKHASGIAKRLHEVPIRFHKLTKAAAEEVSLENLLPHTRMIDEHLSLLLERYLTSFLEFCEYQEAEQSAYKKIAWILVKEMQYRGEAGYSTSEPNPDVKRQLEEYVYREKMLKRYVSEVLFFRVKKTDEAKRAEHVLYALAAGIAMVFATAIAFVGQTTFGNITTSLFLLLVVSYMVKDRLKDFFRDLFARTIGTRYPDRKESLYDAIKDKKLAVVRERVAFEKEWKLETPVRTLRNRGSFEQALFASAGEVVLSYRKKVKLKRQALMKTHERIRGLADISIIDLENFLHYLTMQYGRIPVAGGKKRVNIINVQRIYHINLIISYQTRERTTMRRFRLVVDARGIRRVEEVRPNGDSS